MAAHLEHTLQQAFAPLDLDVVDQSHLHAGHAGAPDGGESHFRVRIVSATFSGLSRIARHRAVNELLVTELATKIHALTLELLTPEEAAR